MKFQVLILAFYAFTAISQEEVKTLSNYSLKGNVKSVKLSYYDSIVVVDSNVIMERSKTKRKRFYKRRDQFLAFNPSGFLVQIQNEGNNDDEYKFNKKNQLKKIKSTYPNSKSTTKFYYTKTNQLKKIMDYKIPFKRWEKTTFKYEKNLLIMKKERDFHFKELFQTTYSYDNHQNLIKLEEYLDGQFSGSEEYKYDSLQRKTDEIHLDSMGRISYSTHYNLNEFGNLILKTETFNYRDYLKKTFYTYDNYWTTREINVILPSSAEFYKIDSLGNMVLIVWLDNGGSESVIYYEYEFDEQKNWTKKTEYIDGTIEEIEIREITYFD